ncbi:MAG: class I SAM-dependent methyltransferase [Gemmataceae bacterium]
MAADDPSCLYCSEDVLNQWYAEVKDYLNFVPGTWSFVRCACCGSALISPLPAPAELAGFYPAVYSFKHETGSTWRRLVSSIEYCLFYRFIYGAQAVIATRRMNRDAGTRVLDIGCGPGLRLLEFQKRGLAPVGLDFKPENTDYVARDLHIPAVCADAAEVATVFAAESFDLVTAFYLVEHVTDVSQLLSSCYRVLRPGGRLAIAVPFIDSVQARWFGSRWVNVIEAPRHISLPSREGMRIALERAGFERVEVRPDAVFAIAGTIALSLVPGGSSGNRHGWLGWKRVAAGLLTLCALPLALIEGHVLKRPGLGIVLAEKPGEVRHQ